MTEAQVLSHIQSIVVRLVKEKGKAAPQVSAETELLGDSVGIDSLDLATLVRELEDLTGHDPFAEGFVDFRTAAELAKLYAR